MTITYEFYFDGDNLIGQATCSKSRITRCLSTLHEGSHLKMDSLVIEAYRQTLVTEMFSILCDVLMQLCEMEALIRFGGDDMATKKQVEAIRKKLANAGYDYDEDDLLHDVAEVLGDEPVETLEELNNEGVTEAFELLDERQGT